MSIIPCVLTALLSFTAVTLNILTIFAVKRTVALSKNLKLLLLNLVFSDTGVGLLVQPLYFALLMMEMDQMDPSSLSSIATYNAYLVTLNFFAASSFLGVTSLTADRFLAVHLHLRYQELVTYKRVVAVVTSNWLFSAFLSLLGLWRENEAAYLILSIQFFCLFATAFFNLKLYSSVKQHTKQINTLQTYPGDQDSDKDRALRTERLKKSAVMIFCVYLVLLVCFLPNLIAGFIEHASNSVLSNERNKLGFMVIDMLIFLNSCINPVIYCWKMKYIRHAVKNILRKIVLRTDSGNVYAEGGSFL